MRGWEGEGKEGEESGKMRGRRESRVEGKEGEQSGGERRTW